MSAELEFKNREEWLQNAVSLIRTILEKHEVTLPEVKVSVGLPHARNQRETMYQVFRAEQTADGIPQIYINPIIADTAAALKFLYLACRVAALNAHRAPLVDELGEQLAMIGEAFGEYPQAAVRLPDVKKQDTRMLKFQCLACGWTGRATLRWIDKGLPVCQCGTKMQLV